MHKVEINSLDAGRATVKVDGLPVRARKVDVHMEEGSVHQVDIELFGEPEMEFEGLVTFGFQPKTVEMATKVLKAALMKNDFIAYMGLSELNRISQKGK